MGRALYREYRSKKLSEIVGQEHITDTLTRALKNNRISHAYLLTGPRGIGKTSIARILAHEINNLPYGSEETHLDIIEIDAASNRRIDEIRELNDRIHIAPTSAKYKVYIIDEVHMLTKEAFNALLKTLEEPPEHAVFILATTEVHKIPETILSRTQRFTFKPVELPKVVKHLRHIADKESITIDDEALALIAEHGEGSFRDSISLLDQVRHTADAVTLADVQRAIGQAPDTLFAALLQGLAGSDTQAIAKALQDLRAHGVQAAQVAKQLAAALRQELLSGKPTIEQQQTIALIKDLLHVPSSNNPSLTLELAIIGAGLTEAVTPPTPAPTPVAKIVPKPTAVEQKETPAVTSDKPAPKDTIPKSEPKPKPEPTTPEDVKAPQAPAESLDDETWTKALNTIKATHNTLYGITRMATPSFAGNTVTLQFAFPFHQKRMSESKNRQLLVDTLTDVMGRKVEINIVLDPNRKQSPPATVAVENNTKDDLKNISNIFDGAEIVN